MRDVMTGETYYDDPDRDLKPEPVLLGRCGYTWKPNRITDVIDTVTTDTEKER